MQKMRRGRSARPSLTAVDESDDQEQMMDFKQLDCPKCQGEMMRGFIADFSHSQILVSNWIEGAPEWSFWLGTKAPKERRIPIATF
jgi:hypothetical protein